jgi:hypothetical protein
MVGFSVACMIIHFVLQHKVALKVQKMCSSIVQFVSHA